MGRKAVKPCAQIIPRKNMKTAAWPSIVRQCQTQNPFMFNNIIRTQVNILNIKNVLRQVKKNPIYGVNVLNVWESKPYHFIIMPASGRWSYRPSKLQASVKRLE